MRFARLASTVALMALTAAAAAANGLPEPRHQPAPSPAGVHPAGMQASAQPGDRGCLPPIRFPQGQEELSEDDIRVTLDQYMVRIGLESAPLALRETEDETIVAVLGDARNGLRVAIEVDPATAEILDLRTSGPIAAQHKRYTARLRQHVMGDGKTWANWVGKFDVRLFCGDDYGAEPPAITEVSTP